MLAKSPPPPAVYSQTRDRLVAWYNENPISLYRQIGITMVVVFGLFFLAATLPIVMVLRLFVRVRKAGSSWAAANPEMLFKFDVLVAVKHVLTLVAIPSLLWFGGKNSLPIVAAVLLSLFTAPGDFNRVYEHIKERRKTEIVRPPGSRCGDVLGVLCSRKTMERIIQPIINDTAQEWMLAYAQGHMLRSLVLRLRCYWELSKALGLHLALRLFWDWLGSVSKSSI